MLRSFLASCLIVLLAGPSKAQPGSLDPTFNGGGFVTFDQATVQDHGRAIAVQPDGRIVMAGYGSAALVLARFMPNGAPDQSFGTDGEVVLGDTVLLAYGMTLQPDGRILICGAQRIGMEVEMVVMRFNNDGSPDLAFNGDGKVVLDRPGTNDHANRIVVQSDGRIVTVGSSCGDFPACDILATRFLSNGTLDASFGNGGVAVIDLTPDEDMGYGLLLRPDGRFILGGQKGSQQVNTMAFVGLASDGTSDASFSAYVPNEVGRSVSYDLALLPDGGFLAVGSSFNGMENDFALVRFDPDGWPDVDFGMNGVVTTDFGGSTDNAVSMVVQPDDRIIVIGVSIGPDWSRDIALARYEANGDLDISFGSNGLVRTDIMGENELAFDGELQADGKLVVSGMTTIDGDEDFLILRYLTGLPMAIEDPSSSDPLRIQRTSEGATLSTPGPIVGQLQVMDATGRTLVQQAWNGQALRINPGSEGVYLVHLRTAQGRWTQRIVLGQE